MQSRTIAIDGYLYTINRVDIPPRKYHYVKIERIKPLLDKEHVGTISLREKIADEDSNQLRFNYEDN